MRGTAVVVGGGLGGITAAVALRQVGWQVTVLERAAEFGEVGAGVGMMPNAVRALDALGLGDEVRRVGTPRVPGGVRDPKGRALSYVDVAELDRLAGRPVAIHRADLHRVLRAALPPECLVTSADVQEVTPEVRYLDGDRPVVLAPDLVVAADGIGSRTRALLWPAAPAPVYAGTTTWRGVTGPEFADDLEISQALGPNTEFGVLPLAGGRVAWYGAVVAPRGERAEDEAAAVRKVFGSWYDPIPRLLAATDPETVLRHDIFELGTPLPTYVRGRVALLGDAAHAMTPYLGQGACMAIEDGVVLAAACAAHDDLDAALARYDRERRPRTQAMAKASRLAGRMGHRLANPVAVALRDAVLRLTPSRVVVRQMAKFSGWRPPTLPVSPDQVNFESDPEHR